MTHSETDQSPTPLEIGYHCAALHSRVFSRLVTRHYNHKLSDTGLRVTQFSILNAIKARPPESIHQLADLLGMERTSLQRTVERLIEKGALRTEPTGHKRALGLTLTSKGEELYAKARARWIEANADFEELVGRDEWANVARLLHRFSEKVKHSL